VSDLYNMSGNVAEWENSCDERTGECLVRGGSRMSLDADYDKKIEALMANEDLTDEERTQERERLTRPLVGCVTRDARAATTRAPNIGFRCCL
jgi:hypothetical protein